MREPVREDDRAVIDAGYPEALGLHRSGFSPAGLAGRFELEVQGFSFLRLALHGRSAAIQVAKIDAKSVTS